MVARWLAWAPMTQSSSIDISRVLPQYLKMSQDHPSKSFDSFHQKLTGWGQFRFSCLWVEFITSFPSRAINSNALIQSVSVYKRAYLGLIQNYWLVKRYHKEAARMACAREDAVYDELDSLVYDSTSGTARNRWLNLAWMYIYIIMYLHSEWPYYEQSGFM